MIHNLQFLRAIAAAMVVLHHARDGLSRSFPQAGDYVLGAAGVDIFFVLSGVVITLAERRRSWGPGGFALRRAARVVPMYWLALVVVGILLVMGLSPIGVQTADATVPNMLRSMFFVPFERAHGAMMPLLGVGWTLNFEVFFYAVFASLMFLPSHLRAAGVIATLIGVVGLGALVRPVGVAWAFYTNPILLEFAAGVALAHLWSAHQHRQTFDVAIGLSLIGLGVGLLLWNAQYSEFEQLMVARVLVFGVPAVLCVSGAMLLERAGLSVRAPFAMLIGAASYSLYLFHVVVLQCLEVLASFLGFEVSGTLSVLGMAAAGIVMSHVVAIILHLWIEKPMTDFLSGPKAVMRPA